MSSVEDIIRAGETYGLRQGPGMPPPTTSSQPSTYLGNSLAALKRIPSELGANVKDFVGNWGETIAQAGVGMLPGAGVVEAPQNYAAGNEDFREGRYIQGATQYGMGAWNQATDLMPGTPTLHASWLKPTLAAAAVPAATRGQRMADLTKQYERPALPAHSGHQTQYAAPKQSTAFEDMTRKVEADPENTLADWKEADLEKMIGGYGFPLVGDRTEAGQLLTEVGGVKLPWATKLQGGYQYGMGEASRSPDASGWASHAAQIKALDKRINGIREQIGPDADLYGIFSGMAERGVDFSTMPSDALLGLVPSRGMSDANKASFDSLMRDRLAADAAKKKGKEPFYWPGLENLEGTRAALMNVKAGDLRKAFMETADSKKAMDLGMPEVGQVRSAVTAPHLRDWTGAGATGGSIMKFNPGGKIITNPKHGHLTYPHQFPAEYVGGTSVNFDRNEFFPGTVGEQFAIPRSTGDPRSWANVDRIFQVGSEPLEKFDREWFENLMTAKERRLREGR